MVADGIRPAGGGGKQADQGAATQHEDEAHGTGCGIHRNQSAADHQVEPGRTVQRPLPRGRLWAEKHDGMRGNGNGAGDELPQMAKDGNRQQLLRLV